MPIILDTNKFQVFAHDKPHHHRDNGGHVVVTPKEKYGDRTQMPIDLYTTLMQLVALVGEAVTNVMLSNGIKIARINYQDNGNWSYFPKTKKDPQIHIHLYVRSHDEKHPAGDDRFKAFPDALVFPYMGENPEYYELFKPYTPEDCSGILQEIERLLETDKYREVKKNL